MRIHVVDDETLFRLGLRDLCTRLSPVSDVTDGILPFLRYMQDQGSRHIDLLLVGLTGARPLLPDISRVLALRADNPGMKIMLLADNNMTGHDAMHCLSNGICGIIRRTSSLEEVREAIGRAVRGEIFISPGIVHMHDVDIAPDGAASLTVSKELMLTNRQQQVLSMLCAGMRPIQISTELNVSLNTIRQHLSLIYRILGVNSASAAIVRAIQSGMRQYAMAS